jgi:pentose-5-phosphate-3-epimerase
MVEIIPAVLPKSFEELEEGLSRLRGVMPFVQIDFVGTNVLADKEAIPFWEEFDFEADVMLPHPSQEIRRMIELGASRIVVHADASDARTALEMLQETRGGDFGIMVGVALGAEDAPETLAPFEGLYDYVQVMGITHVGKQGEPFNPASLELIKNLHAKWPELLIQVDGAAATHPRELAEAGASRLIVGSAVMTADNPKEVIQTLYTRANARS